MENCTSSLDYSLINITGNQSEEEIIAAIFNVIEKLQNGGKQYLSEDDKKNNKFKYFAEHLEHIGLRTIVIELNYRDRQYIEDHSHYYSRSFKHYSRRCLRLHFFKEEFDDNSFIDILKHYNESGDNKNHKKIIDSYCGFTVIKPLPFTIFGKTCIKPYEAAKSFKEGNITKQGTRHFDTIREYKVNLFGIELRIESVAFQEQDNQVFVCATTALWVAFQCTSVLFGHTLPTPYEITLQATGRKTAGRDGLNPKEIMKAISEQELHPIRIKPRTISQTKAVLYAYLKGKIPFILGTRIVPAGKIKNFSQDEEIYDAHAITVLGFDMINKPCTPFERYQKDQKERNNLFLKSSLMEQIYVHDDQIGAFTRLKFEDEQTKSNLIRFKESQWNVLIEKYKDLNPIFVLDLMFLPLYQKIRIPFEKVLEITDEFNDYALPRGTNNIVWDIYLTTTSQLKNSLRKRTNYFTNKSLYESILLEILTSSLPRFIWVVDAYTSNTLDKSPEFSFYFDATDMENGDFFLFYLPGNEVIYKQITNYLLKMLNENESQYNLSCNSSSPPSYQIKQLFRHLIEIQEVTDKSYNNHTINEKIESLMFNFVEENNKI